MKIASNGIELEVEDFPPQPPSAQAVPIVLIMGLGMQLIAWPEEFVQDLVERGHRVIRFDNRDAGLSTQFNQATVGSPLVTFARAQLGLPVSAPYLLDDLAADTIGLLDALGISRAHVVGASMGGMVAQIVAARYATRVQSLTLLMTTSGSRHLPTARWDAMLALVRSPPSGATLEQLIDHYINVFGVIGSPGFPTDNARLRQQFECSLRRANRPMGTMRQLIAILASGDREALLPQIKAPTLVIHGDADPLVPVSHGRDLAQRIRGAKLRVVPGMGHDLAPGLLPLFVEAIHEHAQSSS